MSNNEYLSAYSADSMEYEIDQAMDFLIQNGILQTTPEGLKTTDFGMLIAKSNYAVETAVRLREFARTCTEMDVNRLIYEMCRTPDIPVISFKGRKSKEPVRDRLNKEGCLLWMSETARPQQQPSWNG